MNKQLGPPDAPTLEVVLKEFWLCEKPRLGRPSEVAGYRVGRPSRLVGLPGSGNHRRMLQARQFGPPRMALSRPASAAWRISEHIMLRFLPKSLVVNLSDGHWPAGGDMVHC